MAASPARMIPLGYGKFVRADRIYAVVPLEADERGDGRRTLVHVEGIAEPILPPPGRGHPRADPRLPLRARHPRRPRGGIRGSAPPPPSAARPVRASLLTG